MRQHREQRRSLAGVIRPTFAGRPPQFQEISKPRARGKCQHSGAVIGGREDEESAEDERADSQRLIQRRPDEEKHEEVEGGKDNPV